MRDIIWTIIIIWVVWRVLDLFRGFNQVKSTQTHANQNQNYRHQSNHSNTHQDTPKKGHLKPDAGEYVDFEETK